MPIMTECVDFRGQDNLRGRIEGRDRLMISSEPNVYAMRFVL